MKELKFDVILMKDVPDPPLGFRGSQFDSLYAEIKRLGYVEKDAVRVPGLDKKRMTYMRSQLQAMAKREGLRMLSSRNQDSTVAFFWVIKQKKDV